MGRLLIMDLSKAVSSKGTHAVHSISVHGEINEGTRLALSMGADISKTVSNGDTHSFIQRDATEFVPGSLTSMTKNGATVVVGELEKKRKPLKGKKDGQNPTTGNSGDGAAPDGYSSDPNEGQGGSASKAVLLPMVKGTDGKLMIKGLGDDENRISLNFRQTKDGIEPVYLSISREHPVDVCGGQAYLPYNSPYPGCIPCLMEGVDAEEEADEYDPKAMEIIQSLVELFLGLGVEGDGEDMSDSEKSCVLAMEKFKANGYRKGMDEELLKDVATSGNHPIDRSVVTKIPAKGPDTGELNSGKKKPSKKYALGVMPEEYPGKDSAKRPMATAAPFAGIPTKPEGKE